MALMPFEEMMGRARRGGYAVGYFESWNLESLLAVADAAESSRSPVILGFSGIYLPHPERQLPEPLSVYAQMGLARCRGLSVPACLLFNESPHLPWVLAAVDAGFNLVMFSDERLAIEEQTARVRRVCLHAHAAGCAVEGELAALAGVGGDLVTAREESRFTDPAAARTFVDETGVDALAVDVGQSHLHGRAKVRLDFDRLARIAATIDVPLVLHGASSIEPADLVEGVRLGIRKINVGSALKQAFFGALRAACERTPPNTNPYEIVGSGLAADVMMAGRRAIERSVEEYMAVFGSAGRA